MKQVEIKEILRSDVFRILYEDQKAILFFDRRVLFNFQGSQNELLDRIKRIISNSQNKINLRCLNYLNDGTISGRIYLNDKHLSAYL
jgi:hypothetical protein